MKITLPKPPSINHIYGYTSRGGFARSYITAKGKAWFEESGYRLNSQNTKKLHFSENNLSITIDLYTAYRQDVDNIVKPTMDLFQKNGVIDNDSQVIQLLVRKHRTKRDEEKIEVELVELT